MTQDEILAMTPGRELDVRVAEDVMGCRVVKDEIFGDTEGYKLFRDNVPASRRLDNQVFGPLRRYSQDMAAAREVIEKMDLDNFSVRVEFDHFKEEWEAEFVDFDGRRKYPVVRAASAAEAVSKAALLTVLEVKNG